MVGKYNSFKMKAVRKIKSVITCIIFTCGWIGCDSVYKAGNLIYLGYPIETSLKSDLILQYLDTMIQNYGYAAPAKWESDRKLIDLDSVNNKRIYFKDNPEEMYLLTFGGVPMLGDVYNPNLNEVGYVADRKLLPKQEEIRIMNRLKHEVLDVVEAMAKRDNLPDSLIYRKD